MLPHGGLFPNYGAGPYVPGYGIPPRQRFICVCVCVFSPLISRSCSEIRVLVVAMDLIFGVRAPASWPAALCYDRLGTLRYPCPEIL